MDKEWDGDRGGREQWVAWLAGVMREALHVLKPGGHALVWALPRTSHWTATALEDAGFEVRDIVMHLFGTGFPKSLDVSKAIDKQKDNREAVLAVTRWIAEARNRAGLTNAQIDAFFGFNGMAGHWTSQGAQPHVPHEDYWPALLELLGVNELPEAIRSLAEGLISDKGKPGPDWFRRPVTGTHKEAAAGQRWLANNGLRSTPAPSSRRDIPATDAARQWQGWGTALKPAAEHWILARKPLVGTVAKNVLVHRTGALNIDGCRSSTEGKERWPSHVTFGEEAATHLSAEVPRFFYVAKPSRAERHAGVGHNFHPTVKPVGLMRWLCRLVTPPGGTVLDLFTGSGTTGIAALAEGFEFVGIEREPEYLALARARIEHALKQVRGEVTP
ncbi:site-specific DNA-methyltransferase [Corallococcus sp. bb12-1]|nr:site-specific DNA-methyltransferase [Corallococcus sp. bb12-1]